MGLEIAELIMDIEDHLESISGNSLKIPNLSISSFIVSDFAEHISNIARMSNIEVSKDYLIGFMVGVIYTKENGSIRNKISGDSHLIKDLGYG